MYIQRCYLSRVVSFLREKSTIGNIAVLSSFRGKAASGTMLTVTDKRKKNRRSFLDTSSFTQN